MARETAADKALRLIGEQRVRFVALSPSACAAEVRGDSGDYMVTFRNRWSCDCEHGSMSNRKCSHVMAAETIYRAVVGALTTERKGEMAYGR